jgi:hypothetical protein
MLSIQQYQRRGQNRFCLERAKQVLTLEGKEGGGQGEELAQTMYEHMNK